MVIADLLLNTRITIDDTVLQQPDAVIACSYAANANARVCGFCDLQNICMNIADHCEWIYGIHVNGNGEFLV